MIDVVDGVGAVGRTGGPHVCGDSLGNLLSLEPVRCCVESGYVTVVVELVEGNAVVAPRKGFNETVDGIAAHDTSKGFLQRVDEGVEGDVKSVLALSLLPRWWILDQGV